MATEEMIDVIDENGNIIDIKTKSEIYDNKLSHGIVHVLIYDDQGRLACQIRSMKKSYCPGYVSTSVGGHISSGETPEEAAIREMLEEIGKQGSLEPKFSKWYEGEEKIKKILHVYRSEVAEPFELNEDEVAEMVWLGLEELRNLPDNKIHPELKFIVNHLLDEKN